MPFKFSRCFAFQTPDVDRLVAFYRDTMGLPVVSTNTPPELAAGQNRMFVDQSDKSGDVIFEFIVPELTAARAELEAAGCTVLIWEGKGGRCYIRDPFGFMFNLWEDPEEFK